MTTLIVLVDGRERIRESCPPGPDGHWNDAVRRSIGDLVHECKSAGKSCAILSEQDGVTRILARC